MTNTRVRRWTPAVLVLAFGAGLLLRPGSADSQMLQMQLQVLSQFQTLPNLLTNQAGQLQVQLDRAQAAHNQALSQAYSQALELSSQGFQTVLAGVSDLGSTLASLAHDMSSMTASTRAMSCPVFVDQGVLIGEDSCAWMSVTGQRTRQFSIDSNAVTYNIGGQKEVVPDWFIGGALGIGSSWRQTDNGFSSLGRTFEGSFAVKHTMGPWLVAAGIAATTSATHMTRLATGPSPVVQSDSSVFHGAGDLRVTYDFAFDGWYLRPRFDFTILYMNMPGFQEYGQSATTLAVSGLDKVNVVMTPMVEVGGRYAIGAETILRPYMAVGTSLLPNNDETVVASFTGPLAFLGSFQQSLAGPTLLGNVEAGLQFYRAHGAEMRVEYKLSAGDSFLSQSASLRGAYHF